MTTIIMSSFRSRYERFWIRIAIAALVVTFGSKLYAGEQDRRLSVRDALWVWGNPEMGQPGAHSAASFAEATPAQRARILGTPNIVMAGAGLPHDPELAAAWSTEVADAGRLVWEIMSDGQQEHAPPFEFKQRIADLAPLVKKYAQIEAVMMDDMSSVAAAKGFKPEHLKSIKSLLEAHQLPLKLWGVLYTMNLPKETTDPLVRELDVINLWHWHAQDTAGMQEHVAECEKRYPGKPIVLGLYMHDYGGGRPMPLEVHQRQCETALRLLHAKRVQGIVLLSINNNQEVVQWTADWIARVGDQEIGVVGSASAVAEEATAPLKIGDGSPWRFSGEAWSADGNGVITPPNHRNLQSRAFFIGQAYGDFTAEFEYNPSYREVGTGGAGLILRAQDPNHFYAVYLPWGGQALRAKNYWASIVKVSGDGYLRSLKTAWVPGVPSETDRWYKVKVVVKGPTIDAWVDGHKAVSATDDAYAGGAVGLMGYGWYSFRDVKITGKAEAASSWPEKSDIPTHGIAVGLSSQQSQSACVAPNGDVLLASGSQMLRSKDHGRTWGAPESLPNFLGTVADLGSCMFRARDGRLLVQVVRGNGPPEFLMSESTDNGLTWSEPAASAVESGWREDLKLHPAGAIVQTDDGTMIRFLYGGLSNGRDTGNIFTWGNWTRYKAVAIRSTDGGKSWSKPIEIDRPTWTGKTRGEFEGAFDFTEVGSVAIGNKVTALVRPVYSPTMWQCWSDDGGANWDAAARTTFPGYGGPWVIRTQNGTLVCGHRIPHFAVNLSSDGGLNWDEGTVIDFPAWANGTAVEVEPNVLLCAYMNWDQEQPLLVQRVRVHPDRVEPMQP